MKDHDLGTEQPTDGRVRSAPGRYYVPTDTTGSLEGSRIGTSWLAKREHDGPGRPLIVVPSQHHALLDDYIKAATDTNAWVTSMTLRAAHARGWQGGPVLLLRPDVRVIEWFDRGRSRTPICVVQGTDYDTTAWARARRAEDLTTGRPFPAGAPIDPRLATALEHVRDSVDWHGLTTRFEIAILRTILEVLEDRGSVTDALDLETWALEVGWKPAVALKARTVASRLLGHEDPPIDAEEHDSRTADELRARARALIPVIPEPARTEHGQRPAPAGPSKTTRGRTDVSTDRAVVGSVVR